MYTQYNNNIHRSFLPFFFPTLLGLSSRVLLGEWFIKQGRCLLSLLLASQVTMEASQALFNLTTIPDFRELPSLFFLQHRLSQRKLLSERGLK
jgi:hypothetical protein